MVVNLKELFKSNIGWNNVILSKWNCFLLACREYQRFLKMKQALVSWLCLISFHLIFQRFFIITGPYWITDLMDVSLSELQGLVLDREAWRAAIYGVAKSRTWLSDWTELNCRVYQRFLKMKQALVSWLCHLFPFDF